MPRKKKNEYNDYMKMYMRIYRASERDFIKMAKKHFKWIPPKAKKRKKGGKK